MATAGLKMQKISGNICQKKKYCSDTLEMLPRRNKPRKAWRDFINIHTLTDASDENNQTTPFLKGPQVRSTNNNSDFQNSGALHPLVAIVSK